MRCRHLLPISAVSVRQSVCHAGSFGAAFAKSLWSLVSVSSSLEVYTIMRYINLHFIYLIIGNATRVPENPGNPLTHQFSISGVSTAQRSVQKAIRMQQKIKQLRYNNTINNPMLVFHAESLAY